MSLSRIENTTLWRSSLSADIKDRHSELRNELRTAFLKFRKNAEQLVAQIAGHLPGLTKHDISHLDALWETASLIAGENYPLNAFEGFILGGAILLHDSALCFEAYDKGIDGIRETTIWQDAYYAASEEKSNLAEDEWKRIADFQTLRHLHASQAASLVERKWIDPDTKQEVFLIEDQSLRKHTGQLIGQIAASHYWDIERVISTFSSQVNSLATFPREWRIDPIKIACLLRCADAAHIDNERAPDFLHALLKRQGVSFNHWQAQNRLSNVDIDQADPSGSTILFTSTRAFTEDDSDSWWVAYDAATVVDKEIRASNAALESKAGNTPTFQVKRVKGVESPEMMASHIKVEGWAPCNAEIHVGNIEKLVKNLGGEKLYGSHDKLSVVIRELAQNARDAIKARQTLDKDFAGKITLKLHHDGESTWIIIEDNGIGMTHRVITGPLLDFGTSFWKSSLVQSEFPGLLSSKFKATGQFGIGFYSIFMVAEEVYITSKPWKGGIEDTNQLHFKNGLSLRPLLKKGTTNNFGPSVSTQVRLRIKKGELNSNLNIEIKRNTINSTNLNITFEDYLSVICAGIDVPVYLTDFNEQEREVHQNIYAENFDKIKWFRGISLMKYQSSEAIILYAQENAHRLSFIIDEGQILGLAAISTYYSEEQSFLNLRTVGGLAMTVHGRDSRDFIGFIDFLPDSASREGSKFATSKASGSGLMRGDL